MKGINSPKRPTAQESSTKANGIFRVIVPGGASSCSLCTGPVEGVRLLAGKRVYCYSCTKNRQPEIVTQLLGDKTNGSLCPKCGKGNLLGHPKSKILICDNCFLETVRLQAKGVSKC